MTALRYTLAALAAFVLAALAAFVLAAVAGSLAARYTFDHLPPAWFDLEDPTDV